MEDKPDIKTREKFFHPIDFEHVRHKTEINSDDLLASSKIVNGMTKLFKDEKKFTGCAKQICTSC